VVSAIVWDTTTADVLHRFQLPSTGSSVRFSPEGKRLAVGYDDGAILFDADSGEIVYDFNFDSPDVVMSLDFSPDGKRIAMATWHDGASIWDVERKVRILHLPYDESLYGIAFSPDARYVFAGGNQTERNVTTRLWDAESGEVLHEISGHSDDLRDVAYSSNGKWVATVSNDNSARIWDVTGLGGEGPSSNPEGAPKEIWDRFQFMLRYTIDDQDEVIDLWPAGPRQLDGWDPSLVEQFAAKTVN